MTKKSNSSSQLGNELFFALVVGGLIGVGISGFFPGLNWYIPTAISAIVGGASRLLLKKVRYKFKRWWNTQVYHQTIEGYQKILQVPDLDAEIVSGIKAEIVEVHKRYVELVKEDFEQNLLE